MPMMCHVFLSLMVVSSVVRSQASAQTPDTSAAALPAPATTPALTAKQSNDAFRPRVQITTPVMVIDMVLDLLNSDVGMDIEYSGSSSRWSSAEKQKGEERYNPEENKRDRQPSTPASDTAAVAALAASRPTKAKADTGTYTRIDANYNKALSSLSNAQKMFSLKKYALALKEINKSIEVAPNIALAHAVKGSVLYMMGDLEEARTSWEQSLELDPSLDNVRAILLNIR